jgi:outer membrane protein
MRFITATAAAAVLFAAGAQAQAQAPAAAPAVTPDGVASALATTPPNGPPIPGMCVFSAERAIGTSSVGRAYNTRMQQLTQQVEAELTPERNQLQTDAQALQSQQASLAQDVFQQRATQLNQRIQAYQQKEELRSRELDATQQKNLQRIAQEMNPLVVTVYNQRKCSVVLAAEALIQVNPAMDITDDVTKALNAKMASITFDRERIQQQAAAAPAPAPAAAAPARR